MEVALFLAKGGKIRHSSDSSSYLSVATGGWKTREDAVGGVVVTRHILHQFPIRCDGEIASCEPS